MKSTKDSLSALKRRISDFRREIEHHNFLYHTRGEPEISDPEFDLLFRDLIELETEHPELITPDSPTQRVGSAPLGEFPSFPHAVPMLSLNNAFFNREVEAFDKRVRDIVGVDQVTYATEPKVDGFAISLIYDEGKLIHAATRGDGYTGEDVIENVKLVPRIPKVLAGSTPPELIEVRGEVFITETDFVALNNEQRKRGDKVFANPRNLAAGSIRQLAPTAETMEALSFFAYSVVRSKGVTFQRHSESMRWLEDRKIPVCPDPDRDVVSGVNGLIEYFDRIGRKRPSLPYAIDGVVYKVDLLSQQEAIGSLSRAPRFAIAHKFPPEEVRTTLLAIEISVGRTGALTPVAKLAPVLVGGVQVENATLHNEEEVNRKKLRIGDTVIVRRAGDVIPEVVRSTNEQELSESEKFRISRCPVCGSSVVRLPNEAVTRCTGGLNCKAQLKRALLHFGARRAMDIEGLGRKLVDVLVDEIGVSGPADLYRLPDLAWDWLIKERPSSTAQEVFQRSSSEGYRILLKHKAMGISEGISIEKLFATRNQLTDKKVVDTLNYLAVAAIPKAPRIALEARTRSRLGERDAVRLLAQIERSKRVTLDRFIFALGIRHAGEEIAKILSRNAESVRSLMTIDWNALRDAKKRASKKRAKAENSTESLSVAYRGIGPEIFEAVGTFFSEPRNIQEIERILSAGVEPKKTHRKEVPGSPFQNKRLLFTGTLESMKRPEAEKKVEELGGEIASGVTKNLDYLVVGSRPEARPSNKLSKAKELSVPVLSEQEFLELLGREASGSGGVG